MMKRTDKRFYEINERVWIKEDKVIGVIKSLNIKPSQNIYKATVETTRKDGYATIITTKELNLWEIDKNKKTLFKEKRKAVAKQPTILFAKVREGAKIPTKDVSNAGYDVYALFDGEELVINQGQTKLIPTGIASSVLDDYVLVVKERGSTGAKGMAVRAGIVDSNYRGEIFVAINNTSDKKIVISKSIAPIEEENVAVYPYEKAIAQLLLLPVPKANVKEISYEDLQAIPSSRGTGALGSSGK